MFYHRKVLSDDLNCSKVKSSKESIAAFFSVNMFSPVKMFLKVTFCSFNLIKTELTIHEAAFCFEDSQFFLFFMQKNVYGASVIIFEGIMSFADKELLQVRQYVFFFSFLFEEFLTELK